MTMRIGDVYKGPNDGRKEIERWHWDREAEEVCELHDDIDCDAYRGAWVLTGEARKRRWADLAQLAAWSDPITVGDGNGPPWEWRASLDCDRWEHPDGRWYALARPGLWHDSDRMAYDGDGHPSTFKPAEIPF